ncbi:MAG: hypothetical protein ACFB21_07350 [Opitutales bacterium]
MGLPLIAQDDEVYFVSQSGETLYKFDSATGNPPVSLVSTDGPARGLAYGDDFLYWTDSDKLRRYDLSSGADAVLAEDPLLKDIGGLALTDGGKVLFTTPEAQGIFLVSSSLEQVVRGDAPVGITVVQDRLFWTDAGGEVYAAPLEPDPTVTELADSRELGITDSRGIVANDEWVFWVTADADDPDQFYVWRMRVDGSDPEPIFGPETELKDVAILENNLLLISQTGSSGLFQCKFDGGGVSQPVSGIEAEAVVVRPVSPPPAPDVLTTVVSLEFQGDPIVLDADAANPDPDYDRDAVKAQLEVEYTRSDLGTAEGEFRVRAQLLDADGNPVPVAGGGGAGEYTFTSPQTITVGSATAVTRSYDLRLDPDVPLDVDGRYRVRTWLQENLNGTWTTVASSQTETSGRKYYHFTNTVSGDVAVNVLGDLTEVEWLDLSALRTDPTDDHFSFAVEFDLFRYDNFLGANGSDNISVSIEYRLYDSAGTEVPLKTNTYQETFSVGRYAIIGGITGPGGLPGVNRTISVEPQVGVQLDSVNETYRVEATLKHVELPAIGAVADDEDATRALGLLHLNGELFFDNVRTTFTSLANDPNRGVGGVGYVTSSLQVDDSSGSVPARPLFSYGDGSPVNVEVFADGRAVATGGSVSLALPGGVELEDLSRRVGGINVAVSQVTLGPGGATAGQVIVFLPHDLGYQIGGVFPNAQHINILSFGASTYGLDGVLDPDEPIVGSFDPAGPPFWLMYEPLPIRWRMDSFSFDPGAGRFSGTVASVFYNHQNALDDLEAARVANELESSRMAIKPSNEGYYRFVSGASGPIAFTVDPQGRARLEGQLDLTAGEFEAHFPTGTAVRWAGANSRMVFAQGQPRAAESYLDGVNDVSVPYLRICPDGACGASGASGAGVLRLQPDAGRMKFTPDGGLQAGGSMLDNPSLEFDDPALRWGLIGLDPNDLEGTLFAHETSLFARGSFLMPGHFLPGTAHPFSPADTDSGNHYALGAGMILFSGFDPNDRQTAERPFEPDYEVGLADYAGMNFRPPHANFTGFSRLGGEATNFTLTTRSKYYARGPGVTGIHEAQGGTFNQPPAIYGYTIGFSNYGLSFLDSLNEASRTNGVVDIPPPANFDQEFEELKLTCQGELDTAEIPESSGIKQLEYWVGEFQPLALSFVSDTPGPCPTGSTYLALGAKTKAAYVEAPLFGTLGFKPNGRFVTPADGVAEVNSRLPLPSSIPIEGPAGETYAITPVTDLYFNAFDSHPTGDGFVTFAGTIDVPFFEDLRVQVQTSTALLEQEVEIDAPIFLMGGWPDNGWENSNNAHYFNERGFDPQHAAFPAADVTLAEYRTPSGTQYLPRAQQSFLGVQLFDYPLQWDDNLRSFRSPDTITNDFVILEVAHEVPYLSADNAEITFGASYDGLPRISLANMAFNAVDEKLGVAQAITEAAGDQVQQMMTTAVDDLAVMLEDQLHELFDPVLAKLEADILNDFYTDLAVSYQQARQSGRTWNDWINTEVDALVRQYIHDVSVGTSSLLTDRLNELDSAVAGAGNFLTEIDHKLAKVQSGLRAFISEVPVNPQGRVVIPDLNATISLDGSLNIQPPENPVSVDANLPGLLKPAGDGSLQIVQRLIEQLVRNIAPPDVQPIIIAGLQSPGDNLNQQLNALLEESKPTIAQVVAALERVDEAIAQVRGTLAQGKSMQMEIQAINNRAEMEINGVTAEAAAFVTARLERIRVSAHIAADEALDQFPDPFPVEQVNALQAQLRREITDLIFETSMIAEIQTAIKQRIYDLNSRFRSVVDSVFGQVNSLIREVISYALADIDEEINGLLGSLSDVVGSGEIDGYAHIQGDALRKLRMDGKFQWSVPKEMKLAAYLEINQFDSDGSAGCDYGRGATVTEAEIGALDIPLEWISPGMRADVGTKFSFATVQEADPDTGMTRDVTRPQGLAGSIEMTGGTLNFETFEIFEFGAAMAFGAQENYLSATAGIRFSSYEASGGLFFGRTCTLDPIALWDPEVAEVLGDPPFTGAYVYAEAWIPVSEAALGIPASCMFRISAGVGAGVFYFLEGPTYGGKILAGVSGEALCLVSIKGEVFLIGVKSGDQFRFSGEGSISGKAGACPFCLKFRKSVGITYIDSWNVSL